MRPPLSAICLVWVVLAGLLVAPAALGAVRPDDREGMLGPGSVTAAAVVVSPNDQAGVIGVGKVSTTAQPQAFFQGERDYGLFRSDGSIVAPSTPVAVEEPTGTDWGTILAGIGAVALVVLVAGAVIEVTRHHGGPARPVPH